MPALSSDVWLRRVSAWWVTFPDLSRRICDILTDAMVRTATALLLHLFTVEVGSETVDVRDCGTVDLKTFECRDINRSSLIQRVCYDKAQSRMIISIKGVYDQYCELPAQTFDGLMAAPSMGKFFNRNIRGSGPDGPYTCRMHRNSNHQ